MIPSKGDAIYCAEVFPQWHRIPPLKEPIKGSLTWVDGEMIGLQDTPHSGYSLRRSEVFATEREARQRLDAHYTRWIAALEQQLAEAQKLKATNAQHVSPPLGERE